MKNFLFLILTLSVLFLTGGFECASAQNTGRYDCARYTACSSLKDESPTLVIDNYRRQLANENYENLFRFQPSIYLSLERAYDFHQMDLVVDYLKQHGFPKTWAMRIMEAILVCDGVHDDSEPVVVNHTRRGCWILPLDFRGKTIPQLLSHQNKPEN